MYTSALYRHAPIRLQSTLISIRAMTRRLMREGRRFDCVSREIERRQYLSAVELAAWHEAMLGRLLRHAVSHVPFYRDLGLAEMVAESRPKEALAAFPLIDKTIVRENAQRFIANNAKWPLFKGSTSGTTGTPLILYQDLQAINRENAFIWRQLKWAGFRRGDRRAWIRGDLVVPVEVDAPPLWRMNHAEKMLMFSSYHLSEKFAPAYMKALQEFDPVLIQAYPSSIAFLASWLEAEGKTYQGGRLKAIVTSSETLLDEQRSLIEKRFACPVYDWYGQFERVAAIGTCEHGRQHIVSDYSFIELLPAAEGMQEIVGTGYNNYAMPLIRYRTGDFIRLAAEDGCCQCGRSFPLVASVQGRSDDVVKLPDGRQVGRLDHIFKGVEGILEAQIHQERIDRIEILVVPAVSYTHATEKRLYANARARLGLSVEIEVRRVTSIPRTSNGKLRGVVCNV